MSLRKKLVMGAAVVLSVSAVAVSAFAATEETAVVVGNESLKPGEVIEVLQSSAGGNPMMVGLMLTQATLADRVEMVKQMADAMLFAEGARISGLADRDDVALKLKWQRIQLLLEAYLQEISKKWDMSDKAVKKYYSEHKEEFIQAPATHLRHILTSSEKDANNAILDIFKDKDFAKTAEKFSRDTNTAQRGGDLGWMEKGVMPESIDKAIETALPNSLVGPIKTDLGWHVLEVLERRPSKQLTFDEAKDEIVQRLQMSYIAKELEDLRKKVKVEINEKALENIGGIPAAPAAKTPEAPAEEKPADNASK
ncbi:MAG: peptidylprolyl isomerase [Cloacibacillus porcorum]|uniref:peptidylprolyl isomerase n=1 Tax=Cloacibacillus porcorum TaxID=1197717 RepID=UPI0023F09AC1|nr:peptidyl-prolyl cis-trans isomerase [Cloacibacillus porcorum]MCD7877602.1 peptidylprolyl isomerase [Cloacibacillus porcorum]